MSTRLSWDEAPTENRGLTLEVLTSGVNEQQPMAEAMPDSYKPVLLMLQLCVAYRDGGMGGFVVQMRFDWT